MESVLKESKTSVNNLTILNERQKNKAEGRSRNEEQEENG